MKKGFTLVELLAVLVVLSIILSIIVINVNKYANLRKEADFDNIKKIIVESTSSLVTTDSVVSMNVNDKLSSLDGVSNDASCKILYSVLKEKGYMDRDTKNPLTNQLLDDNSYVKVTLNLNKNGYSYEYIYSNYDDNIENCLD